MAHLGSGPRLFLDVFDNVVLRTSSRVVRYLALLEELKGGEATNAILLGDALVRVAVHLLQQFKNGPESG